MKILTIGLFASSILGMVKVHHTLPPIKNPLPVASQETPPASTITFDPPQMLSELEQDTCDYKKLVCNQAEVCLFIAQCVDFDSFLEIESHILGTAACEWNVPVILTEETDTQGKETLVEFTDTIKAWWIYALSHVAEITKKSAITHDLLIDCARTVRHFIDDIANFIITPEENTHLNASYSSQIAALRQELYFNTTHLQSLMHTFHFQNPQKGRHKEYNHAVYKWLPRKIARKDPIQEVLIPNTIARAEKP